MNSPMRFLFAALLLLLGACASSPPQDGAGPSSSWPERQAQLLAMETWQVQGKIALRTPERADSANLDWRQQGQHIDLHLSGPLGMAATHVSSDGRQLKIQQGDQVRIIDASSPAAIAAQTGWPLPVEQMPYWLRGLPAPGAKPDLDLEAGRLRLLSQDGWQVHYQAYGTFGSIDLPTRIQFENSELKARLILRDWRAET